jgi:hypothetical protein
MSVKETEWITIGDEVLCGPASSGDRADSAAESATVEGSLVRVVIECRDGDASRGQTRRYRVRFTNVVRTAFSGEPQEESLYFDTQRGDLDVLVRAITYVRDHAERHAAGQLDQYVEKIRQLGGLVYGPSHFGDLRVV